MLNERVKQVLADVAMNGTRLPSVLFVWLLVPCVACSCPSARAPPLRSFVSVRARGCRSASPNAAFFRLMLNLLLTLDAHAICRRRGVAAAARPQRALGAHHDEHARLPVRVAFLCSRRRSACFRLMFFGWRQSVRCIRRLLAAPEPPSHLDRIPLLRLQFASAPWCWLPTGPAAAPLVPRKGLTLVCSPCVAGRWARTRSRRRPTTPRWCVHLAMQFVQSWPDSAGSLVHSVYALASFSRACFVSWIGEWDAV